MRGKINREETDAGRQAGCLVGGRVRERVRGNAQNCMCATGLYKTNDEKSKSTVRNGRKGACYTSTCISSSSSSNSSVRVRAYERACAREYMCSRVWVVCVCMSVRRGAAGERVRKRGRGSQVCLPTIDIDSQLLFYKMSV